MQRRICQTLLNDYTSPAESLFRKLNILTINEQIKLSVACLVYKCFHGLAPSSLNELFEPVRSCKTHNLRNSELNVALPAPHTEIRKRTISYFGATTWNSIPAHIRTAVTVESFKYKMKSYILSMR